MRYYRWKHFNVVCISHVVKMCTKRYCSKCTKIECCILFYLGVLDEKSQTQEPCCSDLFLFPDESGNVSQEPGPPYTSFTHHSVSDAMARVPTENDDFCIIFAPRANVQVINGCYNWGLKVVLQVEMTKGYLRKSLQIFFISLGSSQRLHSVIYYWGFANVCYTISVTHHSKTQRRMLNICKIKNDFFF